MNETFTNIVATFIVALSITIVSILICIVSYAIGLKNPELVVFAALILALSFEYKNKLLKDNK